MITSNLFLTLYRTQRNAQLGSTLNYTSDSANGTPKY